MTGGQGDKGTGCTGAVAFNRALFENPEPDFSSFFMEL